MAVIKITSDNFEAEVLKSSTPVLIDFYADWCGPCKMMSPVIEQIADENADIKVCKVNVDDEPGIAEKYSVMSIPMFACIQNGELVQKSVGAQPKAAVLKMLGK